MRRGLVSIIIPIYNVERYIEKCLSSVQIQTYENIEVLMVNDGTKDHSGKMAKSFAEKDIRFHYFEKENGGLSSARNLGLENASGEFVYFLDSDDWLKEDYIDKMVNEFENGIDVVISKYLLEDSVIGRIYIPYETEQINRIFTATEMEKEICQRHLNAYPGRGYMLKDTTMPVWKNMYRRIFLEENNIHFVSERIVGAEDYVFNAQIYMAAHAVKVVSCAGCVHVIVEGSLSRRYNPNELEKLLNRRKLVMDYIQVGEPTYRDSRKAALDNETCRGIIDIINSIARADVKNKSRLVRELFKNKEIDSIVKEKKTVNLENKYSICYWIMKVFGAVFLLNCFRILNRNYAVYRLMQYWGRK